MSVVINQQVIDSEEFNELELMLQWFKLEWGDLHDPIPDDVIEVEEDYEIKNTSQIRVSVSEEVWCVISPTERVSYSQTRAAINLRLGVSSLIEQWRMRLYWAVAGSTALFDLRY